jgi:membrane fusion protein, heavy metal efflux system
MNPLGSPGHDPTNTLNTPNTPGRPNPLNNKRTQRLIGAGLAAASMLVAAMSFHKTLPPEAAAPPGIRVDKDSVTLTSDAPQWRAIKVGPVTKPSERWTDAFPARFRVDESEASRVGSPLAGRVTTVQVELGQRVKAGEPLFTVSSPDIAALRAEQQKAAVDLEVAKNAYARTKAMVEARSLPAKDELEGDRQLREAELAQRLAQMKLSSLKVSTHGDNEFTVVAPRDGVVIEKSVLPGQQVTTDQSLVSVADLAVLWVLADLFEADASSVATGVKARVTSPSLPGFSAEALVERVSSVVDPERHTIGVRIKLPNPGDAIRPNMFAQVRFLAPALGNAVEVMGSGLVSDGDKQYVYVEESTGHFVRRSVVAGPLREGRLTIFSGVKLGENVVEQGAVLLDNQIDLSI